MIGTRGIVSGVAALAVLVACFAVRVPDPAVELAARAIVVERATAVVDALDALDAAIEPGLAAARRGAARVVGGDQPPGPTLIEAADLLRGAEPEAATVRRAAAALDGAIRGWRAEADGFTAAIERGELGSIAAQLEASAAAADEFVEMRLRAERTIETLEEALAALEGGDLAEADRLVSDARTDHDALAAWENELLTLPIWIETTDVMIGDVETIVSATRAGDGEAASAAAEAFARDAADGATADRALSIAMSEGGSGVTAAPLVRLAATLDAIGRMRAQATAIRQAIER